MADFFGKLKQTIDKSAKVITAKSTSAIDTTKIKTEISNLNRSKNDYFLKIGKAVYAAGETFDISIVSEEIQLLKNCDADIALKENELERIKRETEEKLENINQSYQSAQDTTETTAPETYEEVVSEESEDESKSE